jgi:hypothetical protein
MKAEHKKSAAAPFPSPTASAVFVAGALSLGDFSPKEKLFLLIVRGKIFRSATHPQSSLSCALGVPASEVRFAVEERKVNNKNESSLRCKRALE